MLQRIGHLENSQNIKFYFQKINCQTSFGEMDYFRFNDFQVCYSIDNQRLTRG